MSYHHQRGRPPLSINQLQPKWGKKTVSENEINRAFAISDEKTQNINEFTNDATAVAAASARTNVSDSTHSMQHVVQSVRNSRNDPIYIDSTLKQSKHHLSLYFSFFSFLFLCVLSKIEFEFSSLFSLFMLKQRFLPISGQLKMFDRNAMDYGTASRARSTHKMPQKYFIFYFRGKGGGCHVLRFLRTMSFSEQPTVPLHISLRLLLFCISFWFLFRCENSALFFSNKC